MLVTLDLVRAAVALMLPFVTQVWEIYVLIFILQATSAGFTPTFQATIPDVLPDEGDYTKALSLSRLAYDLESLASPVLAAALLTVISFNNLFAGTVFGFLGSAALVMTVVLPNPKPVPPRGVYERTTRGMRLYLATPRLRGLLALNLAVAAGGAIVFVNTVVFVQGVFGLGQPQVALALACFGAGSMLVALALPSLLDRLADRPVMIGGAAIMAIGAALAALVPSFQWMLPLWFVLGMGYSLALTPSGRLLRRSAEPEDRPAIFAAQFALSHACWLITYPLAGWAGARLGLPVAAMMLACVAMLGIVAALALWPAGEPNMLSHEHPDLPPEHQHLLQHGGNGQHAHAITIDALHPRWPTHT